MTDSGYSLNARVGHLDRRAQANLRKLLRSAALSRRWGAVRAVAGSLFAERAADPAMRDVPGGRTGLLLKTVRVVGSGEAARQVEEYRLDAALLKELRELEKQAAVEAGQWSTKPEVRGVVASVSVLPDLDELLQLPVDELLRLHRETLGLPHKG